MGDETISSIIALAVLFINSESSFLYGKSLGLRYRLIYCKPF